MWWAELSRSSAHEQSCPLGGCHCLTTAGRHDSDDNDNSKKSEVVQLDPVPEEKEEQIEDAEKVEEMVQKEELKVEENANEEPTRCLILK